MVILSLELYFTKMSHTRILSNDLKQERLRHCRTDSFQVIFNVSPFCLDVKYGVKIIRILLVEPNISSAVREDSNKYSIY